MLSAKKLKQQRGKIIYSGKALQDFAEGATL